MIDDPIVEEIRNIRDQLSKKFNYDIEAIFRDAQKRQTLSKRKVVTRKPRKPKSG
jgi:hypothetical protein